MWLLLLVVLGGSVASRVVNRRPKHAPAPTSTTTVSSGGAATTSDPFAGIPQQGVTLGDPNAPVELIEFADLQCPYCAIVNKELIPSLVQRYVRTGQVKLVFRTLMFVGPDSKRLAQAAAAMGLQDRLWQFVHLAFQRQGRENSGYADDAFITSVAKAVAGADVSRVMADRTSPAADAVLREASAEADRLGVRATPTFFVVGPDKQPHEVDVRELMGPNPPT
jgi:protein-disulfide isomerase